MSANPCSSGVGGQRQRLCQVPLPTGATRCSATPIPRQEQAGTEGFGGRPARTGTRDGGFYQCSRLLEPFDQDESQGGQLHARNQSKVRRVLACYTHALPDPVGGSQLIGLLHPAAAGQHVCWCYYLEVWRESY